MKGSHRTPKRLYIMTGKGGVGKTTLALAFTHWLNSQGYDATYVTLSQQKLQDEKHPQPILPKGWEKTPHFFLELEEAAEGYITTKLGSGLIAKFVVRTAFFRALVNMLPGFGYVISLGKMLQMLKDSNEQRILVLDAPASGHALTMLEATANFREIFQAGLVFDDTERMLARLYDPAYTGVRIFSLPTQMAMNEAIELKAAVQELAPMDCQIVLNQTLSSWDQELAQAPTALKEKLRLEIEVGEQFSVQINHRVPFSTASTASGFIQDIDSQMAGIL